MPHRSQPHRTAFAIFATTPAASSNYNALIDAFSTVVSITAAATVAIIAASAGSANTVNSAATANDVLLDPYTSSLAKSFFR